MPSSAEHKEKAELNCEFIKTAVGTAPDWAAVVAFYAALHMVERLAACESIHNGKHADRLHYLKKHKTHRAIHADFLVLLDASLIARYGTVNQFNKAFPSGAVETVLIAQNLSTIQSYVDKQFT